MNVRKPYIKPEVKEFVLDTSISLMMVSNPGHRPPKPPKGGGGVANTTTQDPFASPFGDKPFNQ